MGLSPLKKKMRSFLKERISFHEAGSKDAKKALAEATSLRRVEAASSADPERINCLRNAPQEQRRLANWHQSRLYKLRQKRAKLFPKKE